MFFSFDGIDGVGKSTQIGLFCQWLSDSALEVVACRDPGTSTIGEAIRELLLGSRGAGMAMNTEMLLYMAARAQLVAEIIEPALARQAVVVADRYLLANVVYQGHAGGLEPETIWQVGHIATLGIIPDLTFLLDMPEDAARARLDRRLDRVEQRGDDFRRRLRQGYLLEAKRHPDQIVVIDANRPLDAVQETIRHEAQRILTV